MQKHNHKYVFTETYEFQLTEKIQSNPLIINKAKIMWSQSGAT